MTNQRPRQAHPLQTLVKNVLFVLMVIIGLISAFFTYFARDYVRYPEVVAQNITITSPDGVTLHIDHWWQLESYDLLLVTITNHSDTPFETAGFRYDNQPLPAPPDTIRPWVAAPIPLPAVIQPGESASGALNLPHLPRERTEPPHLHHPHGPLDVTIYQRYHR